VRIPPSVPFDQLAGWVTKRAIYVAGFHHYSWYPNCCVQAKVDLSEADALRRELNAADPAPGARITFNHIINKAVANALPNHPLFNAKRIWRDTVLVYPRIQVANVVDVAGMASQIIIPDADRISLRELAALSHRLISARRTTLEHRFGRFDRLRKSVRLVNALTWSLPHILRVLHEQSHTSATNLLEARPGTVLVTNPGTLGVADCKAMLFFGQRMCCLRIMAIEQRAELVDGQVRFRKLLPVGLDYDQRLCDAGPAARLLAEIKRNLEQARRYSLGPAVAQRD
jgi:pyruvate/2-oxoglutarate dehydrogenase complex dihydrolipoamide acyltransferase (E2) component